MNEASWKRLLSQIRDDNNLVVPVVGPRLLVGSDGQSSLQAPIAKRILDNYGLGAGGLPPFRELNEAVTRIKAAKLPGFNLQDLYSDVHDAIRALSAGGGAIPQPIRQLAEIRDFRLIVTLTPDDMLARSLRQHCAVNEVVHSPKLPMSEVTDLPVGWHTRSGEVHLLYLFGKSRSAPMFAIHDEDVLEYAHNVIARGSHVPSRFLGELQERILLLIGCDFPDWLSRFFLRVTNKNRLSEKDKREWMIEQLGPEESLTCFLRSYSTATEILPDTPPAQFVAELHRRWMAERAANLEGAADPRPEAVPLAPMFFISYSRKTDLPAAEAMAEALLKLGLTKSEVWFDRMAIEPGQQFCNRILDGIRGCRYFLPLLSKAANDRDKGFFFREWRAANDYQKELNYEFRVPIILDVDYHPESYTAEPVREWRDLDFGHAPNGVPDERTADKLQKLVRTTRLSGVRHAQ
jgi:hypothetical protein